MDVSGQPHNSLARLLVGSVHGRILRGQSQSRLQNLKKDETEKAKHPQRDTHFGEGKAAFVMIIMREKLHWFAVRSVSMATTYSRPRKLYLTSMFALRVFNFVAVEFTKVIVIPVSVIVDFNVPVTMTFPVTGS